MAEKKKPRAAKPAKKSPAKAKSAPSKKSKAAPAKKAAAKKPSPPKRKTPRRASRPASSGFDVTKLIDHPLVADLLAVGALAAVGAIADHNVKTRTGEAESGSSRAIKAAGKAAAAAVGKRLMTEVDAIKKASKPKDPKRGSK